MAKKISLPNNWNDHQREKIHGKQSNVHSSRNHIWNLQTNNVGDPNHLNLKLSLLLLGQD